MFPRHVEMIQDGLSFGALLFPDARVWLAVDHTPDTAALQNRGLLTDQYTYTASSSAKIILIKSGSIRWFRRVWA